jgi:hypothetical protein
MAKQATDSTNLPTLEDFTEKSLLNSADAGNGKGDAATSKKDAADTSGAGAAAAAPAAGGKDKKADPPAAATDKDKGSEKDKGAAAGKAAEITPEALTALKAKADADINSLTPEEAAVLIKDGYLEDENAPKETIWDDVKKINGIDLDIDFGDVDPESAEGIAIRDQALQDHTVDNYLQYLRTNFPKSFRLLEHESNGGDINELFNVTSTDYSKIELKAEDVDTQKRVLTEFYKAKGFDDKRITRMIEADEDAKEGLLAAAQDALASLKNTQKQKEEQVLLATKQKQEATTARDNQVRGIIKSITDAGKIGNFALTGKDKEEFYKYALSNVFSDGKEGYQVVLPINDKTLVPVLQQLLFSFKNGDLTEFVERKAADQNVRKLKRRVAQDASKAGAAAEDTTTKGKKLPTLDVFTAQQ